MICVSLPEGPEATEQVVPCNFNTRYDGPINLRNFGGFSNEL